MGVNVGSAGSGISSPGVMNNQGVYNMAVNFGSGGIVQGDIGTGDINNNQESIAEGGTTSQTASASLKMDMPGMDEMEGMMGMMGGMGGGSGGSGGKGGKGKKGGKHLLVLMNLNEV